MLYARTCLLMLSIFISGFDAQTHWTYNEDEWPALCKEGTKQSPIALSREIAQEEEEFSSFIFEQYEVTFPVISENNGHSIEIRLHVQNQPTVRGGGLPHVYILDNLHFHWESEHTVEGRRFPLELHLVHYASSYANVSEALKHTGGVTVFAVLFYLSPDDGEEFEPLVAVIDKVQDQVNTIQEMHVKVDDFLPRDRAGFYRYNGSLTTPGCIEGVIWTVFTNMLPISKDQVKSFPLLRNEEHHQLVKNYRSLQELNGRRVQIRSSPIQQDSGAKSVNACGFMIFLLFIQAVMRLT